MTTIINYGSGNIRAIGNIYDRLSIPYKIADSPEDVKGAKRIILPGVGAFDETMSKLNDSGFREVLDYEVLTNKCLVLGICVGMQILANGSEEGNLKGLGWIRGEVKKFNRALLDSKPKIPHLGWNSVKVNKRNDLFSGIDGDRGFYFLHSYYFDCEDESNVMSTTDYGKSFPSSVNCNNIYGVQFHPEKSHHNGVNLLKNFANIQCLDRE